MDFAFQDIKNDILHTRDPFQNGHPFISFWPQLENRHVKDNFGTSTLSGEKNGCIPHQPYHWKKPPSICCFSFFFRQNFWGSFLIESESDLLTIQMDVT